MNSEKKFPKIFTIHLIKEFFFSLIIFSTIIFSLVIITNFVEELFFLRDANLKKNIYFYSFFFTLTKSLSIFLNLLPFVFLFSSIHFFVKILRNNEFSSLKISGISDTFIIIVPSFFAFFLGIIIILTLSPLGSVMSRYYENERNIISGNNNLIIVNDNGIWVKEEENDKIIIFKADNLLKDSDKIVFNNISIFFFNKSGKLSKNILAKNSYVEEKFFLLKNVQIYSGDTLNQKDNFDEYKLTTNIEIKKLKNIYSNVDTFSIWNINKYLNTIKSRGYYGEDLVIKFHKFISFPFLLFSTVILATVFTINLKKKYDNYTYAFLGVVSGMIIYFLIDLSVAMGKSDRIPLFLSVWLPIIMIVILSLISLLRHNEK